MIDLSVLDNIPELSILEDEGLTLDSIISEMINDYEVKYEELYGEELILYPADERRLLINVTAGKLFQLAEIANERFRQNFIKYMYDESLKNWGANWGFLDNGIRNAKVTLRFHAPGAMQTDVAIPKGTRATAGDNVFFATDEDAVIRAGESHTDAEATCTESGTVGMGYAIGQINTMADPVNYVASVENIDEPAGGHDEYTNDELRKKILNFPNTYSTAGPEGEYEERIKGYSSSIVDAKCITNKEAVANIYVMLEDSKLPGAEYCEEILEYIKSLKCFPDTDKVAVSAPEMVGYRIDATYYIPEEKKDIAASIDEAVRASAETFREYTASRVGRAINPDLLVSYSAAAGASRIAISSPVYQAVRENQVAVCTDAIQIRFGGYEAE